MEEGREERERERSLRQCEHEMVANLAHACSWHSAECPHEVGLDARWGFKGEDTRASQQIHRHL